MEERTLKVMTRGSATSSGAGGPKKARLIQKMALGGTRAIGLIPMHDSGSSDVRREDESALKRSKKRGGLLSRRSVRRKDLQKEGFIGVSVN